MESNTVLRFRSVSARAMFAAASRAKGSISTRWCPPGVTVPDWLQSVQVPTTFSL